MEEGACITTTTILYIRISTRIVIRIIYYIVGVRIDRERTLASTQLLEIVLAREIDEPIHLGLQSNSIYNMYIIYIYIMHR